MAHALYTIIITPITIILEFCYQLIYEITDSKGLAVIALSFVVSLGTLPLYMVAEKWQQTERDTQARLKRGVDRIKAIFKGDEQYMMLTTFYRQNHYHPMMALRSSVSLLIQVPFFIAAYNFLSHLEPLHGYSFWFIKDFGSPDAMFKIGNFRVNILPIAMTLINCVAGAIYTRGFALREKVQVYGMAAIFLVLLYNSPSGLVLYWTMNNVLSLAKNIFYKIKNPRRVLYVILCAVCVVIIYAAVFVLHSRIELRIMVVCLSVVLLAAPFLVSAVTNFFDTHFKTLDKNRKLRNQIFVLSALALALLAGLVIPTTLIESEPVNFCFVDGYKSPFVFVAEPFMQALGLFALWPLCFYVLFSAKTKKVMAIIFVIVLFVASLNCFVFSGEYGPMNVDLTFMQHNIFNLSYTANILNILFSLALPVFVLVLFQKKAKAINSVCVIFALAFFIIATLNIVHIKSSYAGIDEPVSTSTKDPILHLSKNKKNVILFMLDSSLTAFVPELFTARPDLKNQFEGFTFYPNTVTLGHLTMLGVPGIYGGYDYTPYEINLRTDKTLQQKHNEALLTLPDIFSNAGYDVTVADLPYENYLEYPLTDMYKNYPNINRVSPNGAYTDLWYRQNGIEKEPYFSWSIKRNFIWVSFFKMSSPVLLRRFIYANDYWQAYNPYTNMNYFIGTYSVLDFLPELTLCERTDENKDCGDFIMLDNETIHDYIFLQAPDYVPVKNVTDRGNAKYANNPLFSTMMGAYLRLGEFFDYLREQGVYDNTRIILASDHGKSVDEPGLKYSVGGNARISATLLVKDFEAYGEIREDMTFMTNADTPYLATKDIIPDAKNPFTGNPLKVDDKARYVKIARPAAQSTRIRHNTQFKIEYNDWVTVHDNIFVPENWEKYIPE